MTPSQIKLGVKTRKTLFKHKNKVLRACNNIFDITTREILFKKISLIYINSFETLIVWGVNQFCIIQGILWWFKGKNSSRLFCLAMKKEHIVNYWVIWCNLRGSCGLGDDGVIWGGGPPQWGGCVGRYGNSSLDITIISLLCLSTG